MVRVPFTEIEDWMEAHELRPADAARAFGVTTQRFNGWKKRGQVSADASPGVRQVMQERGPVSQGESGGAYLRVRHLDAEGSMGDGRVNADFPEVIRSIDLAEPFIRSIVGFLPPPGRLVIITGRGDSMIPTIQPGEALIVDTGVTTYDGDGLYLINLGHGQQVKRLIDHGAEAGIHVHSDNPAYPAIRLPEGAVVGGKVYLRNRIDRMN